MDGRSHTRSNCLARRKAANGVLSTGGMVRAISRFFQSWSVIGKVDKRCDKARCRRNSTSYLRLRRSTPSTTGSSVGVGGGAKKLCGYH